MKRIFPTLLLIVGLSFFQSLHAQKAVWKELDSFHEVMAKTFHPAEEGKLDPIRARSSEMLEKAIAWQQSAAPGGYDKKAVEVQLDSLVRGAKEIDEMVKDKATDKELKTKLSSLHDLFHQVMEKCEKEDHH